MSRLERLDMDKELCNLLALCINKAGNIKKLCEVTGFSRMTIYNIINGKRTTKSTKRRLEIYAAG